MSTTDPLDALVVAPHPDDAELGMAGTILRMRDERMRVGIVDLTNGEPTPHGSPEIRARETEAASQVLGISWRANLGLANRQLEATLEARHLLAGVIRQVRPRWLFAPYWEDAHPDHVAATQLVEAARFWAKLTKSDLPHAPHYPQRILYYYCVHLNHVPQPSIVVDISPYWDSKAQALASYRSQFLAGREHLDPSFIERLRIEAAFWGQKIGVRYGEPLTSREPVGIGTLGALV